jgi:hypothetical protein
MPGITWRTRPEQVWPAGAERYRQAIEAGLFAVAQRWAPELENYARANAPWTDRTGNARAALHAEPTLEPGRLVKLEIIHGVYYGFYLEGWNPVANRAMLAGGRYQILEPTLDYFAVQIWRDARRMLS